MSASTAGPRRAGLGTVATGWQAAAPSTAANATATRGLMDMSRHPDVRDRADQERADEDPRRPVDLALEAAAGAVAAAEAAVAAADRAAQSGRLWRLDEHARHQQHGEDRLGDDESVLQLGHGRGFYLANRGRPTPRWIRTAR